MTLSKWQKRWNNTKDNKYNKIAPAISKEELKQACIASQAYLQKGSFKDYQTEVRTLHAEKSQKQN